MPLNVPVSMMMKIDCTPTNSMAFISCPKRNGGRTSQSNVLPVRVTTRPSASSALVTGSSKADASFTRLAWRRSEGNSRGGRQCGQHALPQRLRSGPVRAEEGAARRELDGQGQAVGAQCLGV